MTKRGAPPLRPAHERGAALILVIWAIGLMSVMAAMVARDAHLDARESRITRETLSARLLAESAVRLALEAVDDDTGNTETVFPIHCDLPEGRIAVDVRPVSSLIDLNAAQEELLAALFEVLGATGAEAAGMAARIADFRDADASPRPGGAEAQDYQRAGLSWRPANRPFSRTGELSEVLGLDAQMLATALPHLTVHSHSMRVATSHATPEVAAALKLFGAVAEEGIESEEWEADFAGITSGVSGGPIIVRAEVQTGSGQRAALALTYGSRSTGETSFRSIVEEHLTNGGLHLSEGIVLPDPRPCL